LDSIEKLGRIGEDVVWIGRSEVLSN